MPPAALQRTELNAEPMDSLLQIKNVSFAYDNVAVLRNVAMSLSASEVVTLLGPNGSGKSTLIRALLGQLPATGTVSWQSRPLSEWRRRDLARLVAYLPQSPAFEQDQTVREALRLGRAPYWGAFGIESPRDVAVVADVAAMLHLNDLLARRIDQLSGGQRQRVFVGRCLVQEPRALLLDEPSTFLDLRHQVELLQLLRRLARERNVGVLLASHDLNVAASLSDRLVLLDNGTIAAEGPPGDVLDPALLERVYGVPMDRINRGDNQAPAVLPRV
jgi:ABC-type cobalamin/Fe3+-siderophores transport system ATPase subunit